MAKMIGDYNYKMTIAKGLDFKKSKWHVDPKKNKIYIYTGCLVIRVKTVPTGFKNEIKPDWAFIFKYTWSQNSWKFMTKLYACLLHITVLI